ncbi:vesicle transport through interaction with t-SNAREs homolog 1A isoform X1 [Strongylocentrotus purpuratus]|uniref:t-SNARE coiled-coil homology domain-containing protein n=1 Tax=Strongylocentrotus purpuratus TaxID=7668 RepID=A0A7M7RGB6_STRPU|nr:vesicle transport through interaction with t-SNAREs homolog 1A isoform X1 [Strongylocentrotus purpuratus]XP_796642.3 vesicle transport through interaction with t-SNAREs homolog 1A isoform X1 [Strongylocentrotus purpuratus]|eukprot:XP_796642.3 PREDICTED: vesicle transport through interaction with t-SNAREs homolog 1A isoform X1 [Strongylocentrotus purpuratus]
MAAAMEEFEHQFAAVSAEITSKINKIPILSGNDKKQLASSAEKQVDEAHELLEQMNIEIRNIPSAERQKFTTRLKSYQTELNRLEKDLRRSKVSSRDDGAREELLGLDDYRNSEDQKTRLLDNTERLDRTSRKLDAGYRMTIETEQLGQDIVDNLHRDREKIDRSRNRLRDMDSNVGQSSRVLSAMMRRILQNRLIMLFLGLIILSVIILAIYFIAKK